MTDASVLLWARDRREAELIAYEDPVLRLLPDYGARVVYRARSHGDARAPLEVHRLEFPSQGALNGYMTDKRREARSLDRDSAIERTTVPPVPLNQER